MHTVVLCFVTLFLVTMSAGTQFAAAFASETAKFTELRQIMVERDLKGRDITDPKVLEVMGSVKRHEFVPESLKNEAYNDYPLPIGDRQTISQPYIVAFMTQALDIKYGEKVLEIGTGSGYQAAVLAHLTPHVFTIEIIERLAKKTIKRLSRLGYEKIEVKIGDGYQGWKEKSPFDAIIITAAPDHVPQPLLDQLKPGGRIVMPLSTSRFPQELVKIVKTPQGLQTTKLLGVMFVPMTGEAQK